MEKKETEVTFMAIANASVAAIKGYNISTSSYICRNS